MNLAIFSKKLYSFFFERVRENHTISKTNLTRQNVEHVGTHDSRATLQGNDGEKEIVEGNPCASVISGM